MFLAAQAAVAAAAVGYFVGPMLTQTLSIDGKKCGQRAQRRGRKTVSYLCLFIGRGPDTSVIFSQRSTHYATATQEKGIWLLLIFSV